MIGRRSHMISLRTGYGPPNPSFVHCSFMKCHPMTLVLDRAKKLLRLDERGSYHLFIQDDALFGGRMIYLCQIDHLCDIEELTPESYLCVMGAEATSDFTYWDFISYRVAKILREPTEFELVSQGRPCVVRDNASGHQYLKERMHFASSDPLRRVMELDLSARINYPSILRVRWIIREDDEVYVLIDELPYHTLKSRLGRPMPAETGLAIAIGIAKGMNYLHSKGILHLNLTPANVLVVQDPLHPSIPQVFITGLGSSKVVDDISRYVCMSVDQNSKGSRGPIESADGIASTATDVFSFAGILKEIGVGHILSDLTARCESNEVQLRPSFAEIINELMQKVEREFDKVKQYVKDVFSKAVPRDVDLMQENLQVGCDITTDDLRRHLSNIRFIRRHEPVRACVVISQKDETLPASAPIDTLVGSLELRDPETAEDWKLSVEMEMGIDHQFVKVLEGKKEVPDEEIVSEPCIKVCVPVLFDSGAIELYSVDYNQKVDDLYSLIKCKHCVLMCQDRKLERNANFVGLSFPLLAKQIITLTFELMNGSSTKFDFVNTDTVQVARDFIQSRYNMLHEDIGLEVDNVIQPDWRPLSEIRDKCVVVKRLVNGVFRMTLLFGDGRKQAWKFGGRDTVEQVIRNVCQVCGLSYSEKYERNVMFKMDGSPIDKGLCLQDYLASKGKRIVEVCLPKLTECPVLLGAAKTSMFLPANMFVMKVKEQIAERLRVSPDIVRLSKIGGRAIDEETVDEFTESPDSLLQVEVDTKEFQVTILPVVKDLASINLEDKMTWTLRYPYGRTVYDVRQELSQALKQPLKNIHIANLQYPSTREFYPPSLRVELLPSRIVCVICPKPTVLVSVGGVYEAYEIQKQTETVGQAIDSFQTHNQNVLYFMQDQTCLSPSQPMFDIYDDVELVAICKDMIYLSIRMPDYAIGCGPLCIERESDAQLEDKKRTQLCVECKPDAPIEDKKHALYSKYPLLDPGSHHNQGDGTADDILGDSTLMFTDYLSFSWINSESDEPVQVPYRCALLPVYQVKNKIRSEAAFQNRPGDIVLLCDDTVMEDTRLFCCYKCDKAFRIRVDGPAAASQRKILFRMDGTTATYTFQSGTALEDIKKRVASEIDVIDLDLLYRGRVVSGTTEFWEVAASTPVLDVSIKERTITIHDPINNSTQVINVNEDTTARDICQTNKRSLTHVLVSNDTALRMDTHLITLKTPVLHWKSKILP